MEPLHPEVIRTALADAPDAMLIVDAAGTIRFANQSLEALFGYAPHELVGRSVESLMPERFREGHAIYRDQFVTANKARPMGEHRLDLFGLRADGSEFSAEISLKPVYCQEEWLTVAAIRDVTHRATVERELKEARARAERADAAKSHFLATASHDLRQPLQTLALLNGALERIVADRPQAKEVIAQQAQAIAVMSRLLNSLLDLNKLESGAIKPDPTNFRVDTLLEELRTEFAPLAVSKGLSLEVTPSQETVCSDPSLVGQILRNLVSNAIKYTHEGWVALRCRRDTPDFLRIEVVDTGIGISADSLHHIYDEFYQVGGPHHRAREGYGLGLSIVRGLVALLRLKLDVKSEVGQGSLFALTLPTGQNTASIPPRIEEKPLAHSGPTAAHILLVEDDPAVRDATQMLLKTEGYHVTAVASLHEALDHVRQNRRVDLLLTDYHLGDGELGTQVIDGLREVVHRPLKAVLMTGDTSSAMNELPADPLTRMARKPVNADQLLKLLRTMLTTDPPP